MLTILYFEKLLLSLQRNPHNSHLLIETPTMIKLSFPNTAADATLGSSRFWGMPDLPVNTLYPETLFTDGEEQFADPMTFICQLRCEEFAPYDTDKQHSYHDD